MKKLRISLQSLEPLIKKIEELDKAQRLAICVATIVALGALFFYFSASPALKRIKKYEQDYKSTQQKLTVAMNKAKQLERLQKERTMKEAEFRKVMKALPEKKEIPSLLTSISQSGQDTGVEFNSFAPKAESNKGFYGEIPVDINMTGKFHNTVIFFDKVTSLHRIVNIRNIKMLSDKDGLLKTSCQAVTYKFVDQEETAKKGKKKRRKKGKKKR